MSKIPKTKNAPAPKEKPVAKKPEPRITLDLPLSAVDLIYQALAERPWKEVRQLQVFIEQQTHLQLEALKAKDSDPGEKGADGISGSPE